jgi:hypothetical protein
MGFKIHRRLLNKDFVKVLFDLNQDFLEQYEELGDDEFLCRLKPMSAFIPSFFFRVRVRLEGDDLIVSNVADNNFKGAVQLNVLDAVLKGSATEEENVVFFEGDVHLANELPDMVDKALKRIKQKMLVRIKIFIDAL